MEDLFYTFIVLREQNSFSKAADILNSNQSTISRRIGKLEEKYATKFVTYDGQTLKFTEAGDLFYKYCYRFIGDMTNMEMEIKNTSKRLYKKIGISRVFSPFLMRCFEDASGFKIIEKCTDKTSYELDMDIRSCNDLYYNGEKEKYSICFTSFSVNNIHIKSKKLFEDNIVVVSNKKYHPVKPSHHIANFENESIFLTAKDSFISKKISASFKDDNVSFKKITYLSDYLLILEYLNRNPGYTFIPKYLYYEIINNYFKNLAISNLNENYSIPLYINYKTSISKNFTSWLNDYIKVVTDHLFSLKNYEFTQLVIEEKKAQ